MNAQMRRHVLNIAAHRLDINKCLSNSYALTSSSQAKGTKSTSFLTHVSNEVDLVPLACEDGSSLGYLVHFVPYVRKERSGLSTLGLRRWL